MKQINIYYLSIKTVKNNENFIIDFIDNDRLLKAQKYLKEDDYLLSIGGTYLLNYFIGRNISYNEYGKPYIKGKNYFSLSHSGSYVIFSSDELPLGIDIQLNKELNEKTIKKIVNKNESHLNPIKVWSLKEAFVKCLGTGFNLPLSEYEVKEGRFQYQNNIYYSTCLEIDNYVISLVIKSSEEYKMNLIEYKF